MTPPKDGTSPEGASASEFTAPNPDEVRAQLAGEVDVDDQELLAKSLGVLVPVRVERGSQLPPQAELKTPDRAEIVIDTPEQSADISVAQRSIERQNVVLEDLEIPQKVKLAEVRDAITGARSLDELKSKIEPHLAEYNLVESSEGWFTAMPGNREAALILSVVNQERTALEKRGAIEQARHATSRAFETIGEVRQARSERKEHNELLEEAHAENDARDQAARARKEAKVEAERRAEKEAAAERGRLLGEERRKAEDEALMGPDSFEDFVEQEVTKAVKPIRDEIERVRLEQRRLRSVADGMKDMIARKDLEASLMHELSDLTKQIIKVRYEAIAKMEGERIKLTKELREQSRDITAFEQDLKANDYIYTPDEEMHPELTSLLAGANAKLVGAEDEPFKVEDYDIPNKDGHSTRMQRMIYRTKNPSLFVIEEWDRTSGKLKRQAFMKGVNVLVPETKGRFGRKTGELTVSNDRYKELGVISSKDVATDSDTSHGDSYSSHVRNLTRAGGVGIGKARELADPKRKPLPKSNGFIQMLMKEWAKEKPTKKAKKK